MDKTPQASGLVVCGRSAGTTAELVVDGYVDRSTAVQLRQAADAQLTTGATSIVIDASRVTFIDSSGVHALADIHAKVEPHGGRVVVSNPSEIVAHVARVSGLDAMVDLQR